MKKKRFDKELADQIGSYVYLLIDKTKGEIFYVGRGKDNRMFQHEAEALKPNLDEEKISDKIRRINELNSTNNIEYCILRHGLSEKEATIVEAAVIDLLKSKYLDLPRPITNKIRGHHHGVGIMSINEIFERYTKGVLDLENLEHNLLIINIAKSWKTDNLYEVVRGDWRVDVKRAKKMDFVLAENNGAIIGVFKAFEWKPSKEQDDKDNFPEKKKKIKRKNFIGEEVKDPYILDLYLHKRIKKEHGAQNPIRYFYKK